MGRSCRVALERRFRDAVALLHLRRRQCVVVGVVFVVYRLRILQRHGDEAVHTDPVSRRRRRSEGEREPNARVGGEFISISLFSSTLV